ncbi:putative RRXRR domain-containing protein [Bacillus phage vB_BspM_AgentSmith]|nr:putative RRXRR domain-containing protein [Bacillus phage vB_BspM_AgentSmith]
MLNSSDSAKQRWVPVVSSTGKPLMPCSPKRARKLMSKGKAIPRHLKGLFYIKLTDRSDGDVQSVAVGIDPGSSFEGYTVKSATRTFLNVNSLAANAKHIKKIMEARSNSRRARRYRKTPYRANKMNRSRSKGWVPPSTKARWQLKLNILKWFARLYPVTDVVVEDVNVATEKGGSRRNLRFSAIQAGKNWLYGRITELGFTLNTFKGSQTASFRRRLGLFKTTNKASKLFDSHCVDSWVLANEVLGNQPKPDMIHVLELKPLTHTRRQLHRLKFKKGGTRNRYGGTMSLGIQRGTLVEHVKHGKCLIGGNNGVDRVSLHSNHTARRLTKYAKLTDLQLIAHSPWLLVDRLRTCKKEKNARRYNRYLVRNSLLGNM